MDRFERCCDFFQGLQDRITAALEGLDGGKFREDSWDRGDPKPVSDDLDGAWLGGWGRTRVLEGGAVLEKAGVNFSHVRGRFSAAHASSMPGEGRDFRASGVSVVVHPRSPHLPTCHMNVRRLSRGATGWSGGGGDLTPYYLDERDARTFHGSYQAACQAHPGIGDYPKFKAWCDRYFFNSHRGEARGIGGVFFDHLLGRDAETIAFVEAIGDAFLPAVMPIYERHVAETWTEAERDWMLVRRGRYVEFNLVHDRGTHFGLKTGGRTESILMSLPPEVRWRYDHHPEPGSREAALVQVLREPRGWV
jgi:coproporphyrinogen III oxidase